MLSLSTISTNVLIVEGDSKQVEVTTELIHEVVRSNVDSTNSAQRAIELASRTTYQLIIADCNTGEMDGISLLERLKRTSPTTSVILVSSLASIEEAVRATRLGADEYFAKPVNPETFKMAIKRSVARRDLYSGDSVIKGMMLLLNTCQLISGYLDEEKILETVAAYLRRETEPEALALFRVQDGIREQLTTSSDIDPDVVEVLAEGRPLFDEKVGSGSGGIAVFPKTSNQPECVVFRFKCVDEAAYFVVSVAPHWVTPQEEVESRYRLLQAQVLMTGKNIAHYKGVRHLLYLDEPTGLFNTRYMHVCLDKFFDSREKNESSSQKMAILFIDVDKFKSVNDTHGHWVGTKLLFEIAEIIRSMQNSEDIAFRYGGDEFVIMRMSADAQQGFEYGEKLRQAVEKHKFLSKEGLNVNLTVSIGVASCPEHATCKRDIIEAADKAMYSVKRSSRNSVFIAEHLVKQKASA